MTGRATAGGAAALTTDASNAGSLAAVTAAVSAALPTGAAFAQRVVDWQRQHGRHGLPWQGSRDPYRVWLSEVMLQQTQVSTVLRYFGPFLQRFPTVDSLAVAPLDNVLASWSGLGYYSRARNMHRCARAVMAEHGGVFPATSAGLLSLPGIGRSTAAAIAAFCFGERAAILDGNVKRVLTRVLGFDGDLALAPQERALWQHAQALLPGTDVDIYTQGLMDLGATVCLARKPLCPSCPLALQCVAHRLDGVENFPVKTRRLRRTQRESTLLLLLRGPQVWLVQRPARGVWAALWSLPEFESSNALQAAAAQWPGSHGALPTVQHALTHFDWRLHPVRWQWPLKGQRAAHCDIQDHPALSPGRWFGAAEALAMGIPAPVRKLIQAAFEP